MSNKKTIIQKIEEANEFVRMEDGFVYYFPDLCGGLSADNLRVIADELDRRNKNWKEAIEKDTVFDE